MINVESMGLWAGSVWSVLDAQGSLDVKAIKKATKLKEKEIYAALGWLAREGKVNVVENEKDVVVSLIG